MSLDFEKIFVAKKGTCDVNSKIYKIDNKNSFYDSKLEKLILIFHHLGRSGGSSINDLLKRTEEFSNRKLIISNPGQNMSKEFWKGIDFRNIISSHSSFGVHKILNLNSKYFGLLRDPKKLILTKLILHHDEFFDNNSINDIWRKFEFRLDEFVEKIGHCNLLVYEHATYFIDKPELDPHALKSVKPRNNKNYSQKEFRLWSKAAMNPVKLINTNATDLFKKAKTNIHNLFFFVGITELYEETIFLLFDIIGIKKTYLWKPGTYTFRRPLQDEIPVLFQKKINRLIEADCEFYHEQRIKLEQMIKESDFGVELVKYKHACKNPYNRILLELEDRRELLAKTFKRKSNIFKKELLHYENFIESLNLIRKKLVDFTNSDKINNQKYFQNTKMIKFMSHFKLLVSFIKKIMKYFLYITINILKKVIKINYSPLKPEFRTVQKFFVRINKLW